MKLFNEAYNRDTYLDFLAEKFTFSRSLAPITIDNEEIERFEQLGFISTPDDEQLPVFEIHIKPGTQLGRNRVQLRNLVARQIQTEDGALAVYVDEPNQQWRFSFIAIEYALTEDGVTKTQTASKRFTYLLGENTQTRTAKDRFEKLNQQSTLGNLKEAFAVEPLNKEFYDKLYKWYEQAQKEVTFPNDEQAENHIQTSLIRLLTRLLFIWFIKEKKLVNADLFDKEKLPTLIDWQKPSSFYKAILQNLFFATLNRPVIKRSFRTTTNGTANGTNYLVTSIYRYQNYFTNTNKDDIIDLFKQTPFLNGGLFECLDRESSDAEKQVYDNDSNIRPNRSAIRVDGFSDRIDNQLKFDNSLFFNNDENSGLIDLFNQYQFTVEESTPLDIEVALDPELLGKVFENLLASYNPETGQQARKATGSFYTPREIVSYMVDESLKQYFKQYTGLNESQINDLFIEKDIAPENKLNEQQTKTLIQAIDNLKILDPAVGSGAYPMGVLQRLVFILEKTDPENIHFKQQQIDKAEQIQDEASRDSAIEAIEQVFSQQNQHNVYGKKLYLIEHCIYGVDIQPIAIQICKLRFFISLTIEQNPNQDDSDNYGIKALPNLETRFIVANSLLPVGEMPKIMGLWDFDIEKLHKDLAEVRHKHFSAKTLKTKDKYRKEDKTLREEMLTGLTQSGITSEVEASMKKIVAWDLYNQNSTADWFDPQWQFGIQDGFDIVIGNPPYLRVQGIERNISKQFKDIFQSASGSYDLYVLFVEKGLSLLSVKGILNYIMPHKWVNSAFGKGLRNVSKNNIYKFISFGSYQVFNASTYTSLVWFKKNQNQVLNYIGLNRDLNTNQELEKYLHNLKNNNFTNIKNSELDDSNGWTFTDKKNYEILEKLKQQSLQVSDVFEKIFQGIATSKDSVYFLSDCIEEYNQIEGFSKELNKRISIEKDLVKPLLKGSDVRRYATLNSNKFVVLPYQVIDNQFVLYSENTIKNTFPNGYKYLKECEDILRARERGRFDIDGEWFQFGRKQGMLDADKEKIITPEISMGCNMSLDTNNFYTNTKNYNLVKFENVKESYKFYLAILNSQLLWFFIKNTGYVLNGGFYTFKTNYLNSFPLPKINSIENTKPFEILVDKILTAKAHNPNTNTTALETKIDQMVYKLYNLTEDEIDIIEAKK